MHTNRVGTAGHLLLVFAALQAVPAATEDIEWYALDREVVAQLAERDVLAWSEELSGQLDKADLKTLATAMDVFLRSGHPERVAAVIQRLRAEKPPRPLLDDMGNTLIERGLWHSTAKLLETFPGACPGQVHNFIRHWEETGNAKELEDWLKRRCETHWGKWHRYYYDFLQRRGTLLLLINNLHQDILKNPTNWEPVRKYLAAISPLPKDKKPSIEWLGDVARPRYALDSFDFGRTLAHKGHHAAAVKLFDHSLSTPITDYDKHGVAARWSTVIHDPEKVIRRWTKTALAESLKEAGQIKRAQTLIEELTASDDGTIPDYLALLAGGIQEASGQRVVEGRILKAEAEKKNTVPYWLGRAAYYDGRKEHAKAVEAYEKALAVPPDRHRYSAVRAYSDYLARHEQAPKAAELLRAELERVGPEDSLADMVVSRLRYLAREHNVTFPADDPLLWHFLEHRSRWRHVEDRLLRYFLEKSGQQGADAVFDRAEKLAGPKDHPSRRKVLGWILSRHGQPARALPLVKDALERWPEQDSSRRSVAFNLFEIHLAICDWQSAEKIFYSEAHKQLTPREVPEWIGRIAIVAAQAGAADDAMRLWKRCVNYDLTDLSQLRSMARAGIKMKDRLREFYSDLAKRDPGNQAIAAALESESLK